MRRGALAIGFALLAPLAAHGAELPLGRLFFTPAQRAALDEARRKNIRAEELAVQSASKPKAPQPRDVVVNGLLMRSDGMAVIWVNGKAVENETRDGLRVSPTASRESVVLRDPAKGRALRLKVGQRADLLSGRVQENYEARRAAARAEAAAQAASQEPVVNSAAERRSRRPTAQDDKPEAAAAANPVAAAAAPESAAGKSEAPAPEAAANPTGGGDR